jgi:3-deoxy-manno-octulosonate cytidylyltransferase (CMP-KDO synthetase)
VLPVPAPEHSVRPSAVVVIPARYESSRFPGKPLALIAGRPMIEHVYRRALQARDVSRVLVATDDDRIARVVTAFGGEAIMTSGTHPTGTDRLAEVAAGLDCDIIVNVQGDEPLVTPAMIEQAMAPLAADATAVMSSLRTRLTSRAEYFDPNVVKVVVDRHDVALYFSRAPIPHARDATPQDDPPASAWRHIGMYAYRRTFLAIYTRLPPTPLEQGERLEQLRALEHGYRIIVPETPYRSVGVDTPSDLAEVEAMVAAAAGSSHKGHPIR